MYLHGVCRVPLLRARAGLSPHPLRSSQPSVPRSRVTVTRHVLRCPLPPAFSPALSISLCCPSTRPSCFSSSSLLLFFFSSSLHHLFSLSLSISLSLYLSYPPLSILLSLYPPPPHLFFSFSFIVHSFTHLPTMSASTDYSRLKVPELRDILTKRNLPTTGIKAELVARLTSADSASDSAPSPATNNAHLPTADDYEVDWDDNDDPAPASTSAAAAPVAESRPAAADVATTTTSSPEKPKKKKFASIAALFETPAAAAAAAAAAPATTTTLAVTKTPTKSTKDHNSQSPSSPSTVTDDPNTATSASVPKATEPNFAAGLEASSLDVELERRKARAKRFGTESDAPTAEATKKLEREKRFGASAGGEETVAKKEAVKGLDSALPERRERKRGPPAHVEGGRGQKRSRGAPQPVHHNGSGAARSGDRRPNQGPRRNAGGVQKSGGGGERGYRGVLDDPTEKAKADARARKFGVA